MYSSPLGVCLESSVSQFLFLTHTGYIHLLDNQIFGTFPPELGFLSRLSRLELTENNIDGPLPPEIGRLAQLTFMGLGRNNFSGPLPADLDRLRKMSKCQRIVMMCFGMYADLSKPPLIHDQIQWDWS